MTGNFRFSDKHFPANGKPPPDYFTWKDKERQKAWWLASNRRKERGNGEGDLAGLQGSSTPSGATDISSLADEIKAARREHRQRTGDSAREPAQDCQIPPSDMAEESAARATAKEKGKGAVEPHGFRMTAKGLIWSEGDKELVVAGQFEVVAERQDSDDYNWGVLLRWKSSKGVVKDWAMPRSLLAGDGLEVRRALLDGGLYVGASGKARQLLTTYLTLAHSKTFARAVTSTGGSGRPSFYRATRSAVTATWCSCKRRIFSPCI